MIQAGIDPLKVWSSTEVPGFKVGQLGQDENGYVYQFVLADAGGVTGEGYVVCIEASDSVDMVDTTVSAPGAGQGMPVGIAMAAISAAGWGWVLRNGRGNIRVAASAAVGTRLNSTATAGVIDDDGTAGSEEICGVALTTANGGAEAVAAGVVNWPYIGRTL